MRRRSLRLGLSAFLSATLLGGTAHAYAVAEQEPRTCHQYLVAAGSDELFPSEEHEKLTVEDCLKRIEEGQPEEGSKIPSVGRIGVLFSGIASILTAGIGVWTSLDWTDILIQLGSL